MNTIGSVSYETQVSLGQTVQGNVSAGVDSKEDETTQVSSSSMPVDRVEISEEAQALALSSAASATTSEESTTQSSQSGGTGATSATASSSNTLEAQIEVLEKKIAALQKEIAASQSSSDEESMKDVQGKQTLLASYQAQLITLEAQASETTS
ncbi:ABC transporter C-terminal domain-containing protein [Sulfurospirillum barnesii]|uniref:FlxA-like protein n=1 Tax=Sulfurospirillum barnesii (strain ATCC 700032 / DSM 10660 / SES-3) TaxID=760154 RepID=I3XVW1_SULBS|nr:ABC transporter C-terminal domain-containing protein [Sulfurospirillum barnesii]AFL68085.1 hypothetical protein Sulba_0781 [Sulfurospirillum barnesii SES-3]